MTFKPTPCKVLPDMGQAIKIGPFTIQWDNLYFKTIYKFTNEGIADADLPWTPIIRWFNDR